MREVPAGEVAGLEFDLVLTQSRRNFEVDRREILSPEQQERLPLIHLEHDPPRESPADTRHFAAAEADRIVHVTHFNRLMWDNGSAPAEVVEHGVEVPAGIRGPGPQARGAAVINCLARRGRRLGCDLFEQARREVPLDLIGMESEPLGGLGDVPHAEMLARLAGYRFLFHPVRWTSLGLAVCEAMMLGLPVAGLACTELSAVIVNGVNGWIDTDPARLTAHMRRLIDDPEEARRLGEEARRTARTRFGIARFAADWDRVFRSCAAGGAVAAASPAVQGGRL